MTMKTKTTDISNQLGALQGRFGTTVGPVNRMKPLFKDNPTQNLALSKIISDGKEYHVKPRFMASVKRLYGYDDTFLKFCNPATIFDSFAADGKNDAVRVTFDEQQAEALALVPENSPIIEAGDALKVIENDPRLQKVQYAEDGIIEAEFSLDGSWRVASDSDYQPRIKLSAPIDGFTKPNISLGVLRQVCVNGLWTESAQFRSELALGHKAAVPLARMLRSYSNEEGFEALRLRIASARSTQASLNEVFALEQTVTKALVARLRPVLLEEIKQIAGDPCYHYSVVSPRALSAKKRSLLPAKCSVLDLVNIATELATHHRGLLDDNGHRSLMGYVDRTLTKEYNLEEVFEWKGKARSLYLAKNYLN